MSKRTQRTSQTRGTTSVYRLRGLIGYSHLKNGDIFAARYRAHPAPPTTYKKLRGAAQDGNWDAVSPRSCTTGRSLRKNFHSILLDVHHRR